jgi:hypothetical protein
MATNSVGIACANGSWYAIVRIPDDLRVVAVPLTVVGTNLVGDIGTGANRIRVTAVNPCPPVTPDLDYTTVRSSCGCNFAIFGIGKSAVCRGEKTTGGCADLARFQVTLECCNPIDGWDGAGFYCIRAAGTEDEADAGELLESDKCNENIEIVSGPYETLAEAEAECGGEVVPRFNCVLGAGRRISKSTRSRPDLFIQAAAAWPTPSSTSSRRRN